MGGVYSPGGGLPLKSGALFNESGRGGGDDRGPSAPPNGSAPAHYPILFLSELFQTHRPCETSMVLGLGSNYSTMLSVTESKSVPG